MPDGRKALCVGIGDYPGPGPAGLVGCVNDAVDWAEELCRGGYSATVLLDGGATRGAFLRALGDLVASTGYGDRAVVTFSGHGSWVPGANVAAGRDACLVMADYGVVVDDDLAAIFAARRHGSRFVLVVDACHSGTVNRLVDDGHPAVDAGDDIRVRFLPPSLLLPQAHVARAAVAAWAMRRPMRRPGAGTGALLLAGSRDDEFSYDAAFGGRPNGVFTRSALDALAAARSRCGHPTFAEWFAVLNETLPSAGYPQTPHLAGSWRQRQWRVFD